MSVMTVSEARAALPEVLNRVAEGEEVTITRHGRAVAVVVRPDVVWSRSRAEVVLDEAARLGELLDAAGHRASPAEGAGPVTETGPAEGTRPAEGIGERYAQELIASIRADRDGG